MYSEWSSLVEEIRDEERRSLDDSLKAFPPEVGKGVVKLVLKSLNDPQSVPSSQKDSIVMMDFCKPLTTPRQVEWTMSVVSYGLSLSLSDHQLVHLCIDTYEVWITVVNKPEPSVPQPILDNPDLYVQAIFRQLCQVFDERLEIAQFSASGSGSIPSAGQALQNQEILCSRVLRMLHSNFVQNMARLSRESWDCLLTSLLHITDAILAPPYDANSLAVNLKELPINLLFGAWLQASIHAFPRPQLWKSLHEMCVQWRHHKTLAIQWLRLAYTLTYKVVGNLYTENYLSDIVCSPARMDSNFQKIIKPMPYDVSIQCWYRILHMLGDPVELAYPNTIASLPAFKKFQEKEGMASGGGSVSSSSGRLRSSAASSSAAPLTQACLTNLHTIYHQLMRGVATLVFLFQGKDVSWDDSVAVPHVISQGSVRDSLKGRQKLAAGGSSNTNWYMSSKTYRSGSAMSRRRDHSSTTDYENVFGDIRRPKGNTLLQLFGDWLFRAAIWPVESTGARVQGESHFGSLTNLTAPAGMRNPEEMLRYEKGRAEAFGALCSIFSSQDCGEPFQPIYLAKFYHALILGLHYTPEISRGYILTEIFLHSRGLLRKDLMGINLVLPYFIDALDLILPRAQPPFKWMVDLHELRHASIDLLLSMISLPLHFLSQPLPNVFSLLPDLAKKVPVTRFSVSSSERTVEQTATEHEQDPLTFLSLRDPLVQLLLGAITHEANNLNKQLLLHTLNAIICDIVTYEDLQSKVASDESPDDQEESSSVYDQTDGGGGTGTRNEASHRSSKFSPSQLVDKAVLVSKTCLAPTEGDGTDMPVQVCLAALELLSSIAALSPDVCSHPDIRYAVHLVSDFIEFQAMKDLPRHNRDLHTSIVAAFKTLMAFTLAHPYLMGSKETLSCVMRVIELGISGKFSTDPDGNGVYKGQKKDRPISGRVKEIAEFMLHLVMENVYAFPSPCGAEATSSLLNEEDVISRMPLEKRDQAKFQYYLLDNSVLVGLLEGPFTNQPVGDSDISSESLLPTVTGVVRGPSGRQVWSMQLRHSPRSHQPCSDHRCSAKRPDPKPHPPVPSASVERKPWPDEVHQFPSLNLDFSLPSLDEVLDASSQLMHEDIYQITRRQVEEEMRLSRAFYHEMEHSPFPNPKTAVEPPPVQEKFSTARLFLNHLSLMGMESVKEMSTSRCQPLIHLDSSHPKFSKSLAAVDSLPSRFCNTVFVLYCKEGFSKTEEILASNSSLINKPGEFLEFLNSLGWLVDPATHPGFAGKIHPPKEGSSVSSSTSAARPVGISAMIPQRPFPYFTDSVNELAFVVPTLRQAAGDSSASLRSVESSDSGQDLMVNPPSFLLSTQQQQQQGKASTPSPVPHTLAPTTPPGTRHFNQDSSSKPPAPAPSAAPTPTTPSSTVTYMNIDLIAQKPPQFGNKSGGGNVAGNEPASGNITAEGGYATYPGPAHQHPGKPRISRVELPPGGIGGETPRRKWQQQDCAVMIVWLERFEDHASFPVNVLTKLLHSVPQAGGAGSHKGSRKSLPVLFIHKMTSGLYQIMTKSTTGRPDSIAGPLVDGMVVSRRSLGILARQTAINVCSRHRMENEGYFAPHVKRKKRLEEMGRSFKQSLSLADFYTKTLIEH